MLLDENLSRRLVPALQASFPGSSQVALLGLERASDRELWQAAKDEGYVLVTKDEDFRDLQMAWGFPPKIIRLAIGNCTNEVALQVLIRASAQIIHALSQQDIGFIELF